MYIVELGKKQISHKYKYWYQTLLSGSSGVAFSQEDYYLPSAKCFFPCLMAVFFLPISLISMTLVIDKQQNFSPIKLINKFYSKGRY